MYQSDVRRFQSLPKIKPYKILSTINTPFMTSNQKVVQNEISNCRGKTNIKEGTCKRKV